MNRYIIAAFAALLFLAVPSFADPVPVGAADWTGTRDTDGNGMFGIMPWDNGNLKVEWKITYDNVSKNYTYEYWINVESKAVSHWLLEISKFDENGDLIDWGDTFGPDTDVKTFSPGDPSNPGLLTEVYAVKFDYGDLDNHVKFTTTHAPVWGDIYLKDGKNDDKDPIYGYNVGFGMEPDPNGPFLAYIARPDGDTKPPHNIPEPGSLVLLGAAALYAARRRRG